MDIENLKFDIYSINEKIVHIEIAKGEVAEFTVINPEEAKWIPGLKLDGKLDSIMQFLRSRIMTPAQSRSGGGQKLLGMMGLEKWDLIEILRITEGKKSRDCYSVHIA